LNGCAFYTQREAGKSAQTALFWGMVFISSKNSLLYFFVAYIGLPRYLWCRTE